MIIVILLFAYTSSLFLYNLFSLSLSLFFFTRERNKIYVSKTLYFSEELFPLDYHGKSVFIGILSDRLHVQFNKKNIYVFFLA